MPHFSEDGTRLWFGPEVEGRLKDQPRNFTAFIAQELSPGELQRALELVVDQVFLTEKFHDWEWFERVLLPAFEQRPQVVFTVALELQDDERLQLVLAAPWASRVEIMARVYGFSNVLKLRDADQFSVGLPFNIVTASVANSPRTRRNEYDRDLG